MEQGQVLQHPMTLSGVGGGSDTARKRARAWSRARRHTWLVKTLRLLLPMLAVASLGLYFVTGDFSIETPAGNVSVEGVALNSKNLKMINPKFAGFGQGEDSYEVKAESATQDIKAPHKVTLNKITAQLLRSKGDWVRMSASKGFYDTKGTQLDLFGGIRVTTKSGMQADLSSAAVDVKSQEVVSKEPVNVKLPNGTVRADRLRIYPKTNTLRFEGRVKVLLKKQAKDSTAAAPANGQLGAQIKGAVR